MSSPYDRLLSEFVVETLDEFARRFVEQPEADGTHKFLADAVRALVRHLRALNEIALNK